MNGKVDDCVYDKLAASSLIVVGVVCMLMGVGLEGEIAVVTSFVGLVAVGIGSYVHHRCDNVP